MCTSTASFRLRLHDWQLALPYITCGTINLDCAITQVALAITVTTAWTSSGWGWRIGVADVAHHGSSIRSVVGGLAASQHNSQ